MASRLKEDERNERIIRGLLKLPENRRCINCNSLGPQYVCISFWTFVCTTCSGIHREFTHRVKSVSMAKFTTQEVVALQEGGNKSARELFLKDWDSQHNSIPDSSNVNRLRDFIKHVYVDKRYTGDNNYGKPPNMKTSEKKDLYENGRTDSYQGGSRSPPYEDAYDRRINGRSSPGGKSDDKSNRYGHDERRSPGYGQEGRQYNNYRRSTARPEIVNDWRREDRFANGRKTDDDHRVSDGESKFGVRSPALPNDVETSSPPVARPVREILGDNVVPLRVIEPPKSNTVRASDGLSSTQRTVSSSSSESTNENLTEVKRETLASLIDFDSDPMPSVAPAVPQAQSTLVTQTTPQTVAASNDNNWASFDFAPAVKASEVPANPSPLDSVISQLSFMSSVPGPTSTLPNGYGTPPVPTPSVSSYNHNTPGAVPVGSFPTSYPSVSASAATPGFSPIMSLSSDSGNTAVPEAGQWPNMQQQQQPSSVQSTTQQFSAPSNQPWNPALPPNDQATMNATSSAAATGRIELPEDIFAATYNSFPTMNPGWQTRPPGGMMFPMQYANVPAPVQYNNVAAPSPTFVQPSQTANPFDVNEPTPAPAQPFPNMSSLQNALPNTPSASSLGNPTPWMMPNQASPYQSGLYPQLQSYATTAPSRLATSQEPSHMQLPGHQGMPGFGGDLTGFGGINMEQQLAGGFSGGAPLHPLPSAGGNPFG